MSHETSDIDIVNLLVDLTTELRNLRYRHHSEKYDHVRTFIERIGHELYLDGGNKRMLEIYDHIEERYGCPAVLGISPIWHGIGRWVH